MSARLVALVSGFGWHVQDLQRAAGLQGVRLSALRFPQVAATVASTRTQLTAGDVDLCTADGVLVRMMPPGTLEQVIFRMDLLHRLEAAGVPVLNPPRAIESAVDKYLALARVVADGMPAPATWVGESAAEALDAFESLGGDVVVKPLFGSEGRGLVRLSDRELARRAFQTLERLGAVLYVQRFVPHHGYDLRALVLGDRVLGAIRRHAPEGDWRTNVAVGGRAEPVALESGLERLALRAARALGARLAGVDLLPDREGNVLVLEVNAVPGWRALASATGIDVAAEVIDDLSNARKR